LAPAPEFPSQTTNFERLRLLMVAGEADTDP
jgi:hypothetical protein